MKAAVIFTGTGSIPILTSHKSFVDYWQNSERKG